MDGTGARRAGYFDCAGGRGEGFFMIRLDKFLTDMSAGSRSGVKLLLKRGAVTVDGETVRSGSVKIDENKARVVCQGKELSYRKFYYYMLHKPAGVVSATKDNVHRTVMDLCGDIYREDLFPVGRLDRDTEGLLLLTNDGLLAHELLSPVKHVEKTYFVRTGHPVSKQEKMRLETGVEIGAGETAGPAVIRIPEDGQGLYLTITEGKFHQVKRMLKAVGNEAVYLKRISMGGLSLDESLKPGEYRPLSETEIEGLRNR